MAQDGDYPFFVYVCNTFKKESVEDNNPIINVVFNHWPYGKKPVIDNPTATLSSDGYEYSIQPGDMIGFPLYWHDEFLTITITIPPESSAFHTDYYIQMGAKCLSTLKDKDGTNLLSEEGTLTTEQLEFFEFLGMAHGYKCQDPVNEGSYMINHSGVWKIKKTDDAQNLNPNWTSWKMIVNKLVFDPETTNVSVGQDLP